MYVCLYVFICKYLDTKSGRQAFTRFDFDSVRTPSLVGLGWTMPWHDMVNARMYAKNKKQKQKKQVEEAATTATW